MPSFHFGLAAAAAAASHPDPSLAKRAGATCNVANGDLYKFPNASSVISSADTVNLQWNPSCYSSLSTADVYLYASTAGGPIQGWKGVPFQTGSYDLKLNPIWWNDTATAELQFVIADPTLPMFTATPGPYFNVTVPASQLTTTIVSGSSTIVTAASGVLASTKATSTDSIFQTVSIPKPAGLSKGAMVAAILVPLIVVGIAIGIYVRFARMKEAEKRKRWSEHVDRRMSVMSADWRAGAPSVRTMSMHSQMPQGGRPQSTFSTSTGNMGPGMAGAGARGMPSQHGNEMRQSQLRHSILADNASASGFPPAAANANNFQRHSRISFAEGTRMSRASFGDNIQNNLRPVQSNLGIYSNPAANGSRPSVNKINTTPERHSIDNGDVTSFSPSQAQGPFPVSPSTGGFMAKLGSAVGLKDRNKQKQTQKEIAMLERQRTKEEAVQGWRQAEATRRSNDGIRDMEAILLRRSQAMSQYSQHSQHQAPPPQAHGNPPTVYVSNNEDAVEELNNHQHANEAVLARATSPMGMSMPPQGMNPDAMLAAYAAARNATPQASAPGSIADGADAADPTVPSSPILRPSSAASNNPFRQSMIGDDAGQQHGTAK